MKKCKISKTIGWVLAGLTVLLLAVPAFSKIISTPEMVGNFEFMHLSSYLQLVGVAEVIGLVLLLIPRTSAVGAVLIGSLMSAATVIHISLMGGEKVIYPILIGLFAWGSYLFREQKLLCNKKCCQPIKNITSHL